MTGRIRWVVALISTSILCLLGCPSENPPPGGFCEDGTQGCACYGNGTCDEGLDCVEGTCIGPGTGGMDAGPVDGGGHTNPTGSGVSKTSSVGSNGGEVSDDDCRVSVPKGAL